ncbi:MAG TPA: glucokinase [Myxococcaceae bacterium]|nr:glucokinase [Myxococcaceae bacterium]
MILAGDIGGTHARIGLFEVRGGAPALVAERIYPSREFSGLDAVLKKEIEEHHPAISSAAFGIAGPVHDGRVRTPNLPWEVDARSLTAVLGLAHVTLLNDLEALAYGIHLLGPSDVAVLNPGKEGTGNRAVVAAGTGLGVAGLIWDGQIHRPFATEGGHADFAPRNALESELMLHLAKRFGRVSNERVVCGAGLVNVYEFLRDTGRGDEPAWLRERLAKDDRAKVISEAGLDRSSELCSRALDMFASVYGTVTGDVALYFLATGGMYLGGGIAPKVLARLKEPDLFRASFVDKGRLRSLVEQIPVSVVLDDRVGLKGAARAAMREPS